jgi:hypothetical protein
MAMGIQSSVLQPVSCKQHYQVFKTSYSFISAKYLDKRGLNLESIPMASIPDASCFIPPDDNNFSTDVYLINHVNPLLRAQFGLESTESLYRPREMMDAISTRMEGKNWDGDPGFGQLRLSPELLRIEMIANIRLH